MLFGASFFSRLRYGATAPRSRGTVARRALGVVCFRHLQGSNGVRSHAEGGAELEVSPRFQRSKLSPLAPALSTLEAANNSLLLNAGD